MENKTITVLQKAMKGIDKQKNLYLTTWVLACFIIAPLILVYGIGLAMTDSVQIVILSSILYWLIVVYLEAVNQAKVLP